MKSKLMILCLSIPLSAISCPDLAGTYECKPLHGDNQKSTKITILQRDTVFTVNYGTQSNTLVADGKPSVQTVVHPETGLPFKVTLSGLCQGESLVVTGKSVFPKIEGVAHVVKASKDLLVEIEGQFLGRKLDQTLICEE
jgi:hypothetical protein